MSHPLIHKKAPEFSLLDQDGATHTLADYLGEYVLLYFYPKDATPGCTTEAQCFRDRMNEFRAHDVHVLGVSPDSVTSHKKFADKQTLNFPLLADTEKQLINAYGVWVEKSLYGKKYMGVQRDSFLIGPDGTVIKHYEKVNPGKHVDDVIKDIQSKEHRT